jgi:Tol biopolymer transport system component
MLGTRPIGVLACSATLSLVTANGPFTTVEQRNGSRSPRSPRSADVSANGRFVAFESLGRLVSADEDDLPDIYVLDRTNSTVTLETGDLERETDSSNPRLSGDGRLLVFEVRSRDSDRETRVDIILRDRTAGTNRSLTGGLEDGGASAWSRGPVISEDGRFVAFSSASTTMVRGADANGHLEDVYVVRVSSGEIERVSLTSSGVQAPRGTSILPSLSADGRWIAFASTARLDETDTARLAHEAPVRSVFLRDLATGITTKVVRAPRHQANGDSSLPSLSGDARFLAFASNASNLSDNDGNRGTDVFLYDRETTTVTRISRAADKASASGTSVNPVISADGRFIAFQSEAPNLVCAARCQRADEDINLLFDVFVFDRTTGKIVRTSEDELGGWMESSMGPSIDRTGSVVAFSSKHPVDAEDRREDLDLFVRQLKTN